MEFIADIFLVAGALGAGFYCFVLGRRLKRFNDLEKGVGGAIAVLSAQVDELNKTLSAARTTSDASSEALDELTGKAEKAAQRLELLMASMHDVALDGDHGTAEKRDETTESPERAKTPAPDLSSGGVIFKRRDRHSPETTP